MKSLQETLLDRDYESPVMPDWVNTKYWDKAYTWNNVREIKNMTLGILSKKPYAKEIAEFIESHKGNDLDVYVYYGSPGPNPTFVIAGDQYYYDVKYPGAYDDRTQIIRHLWWPGRNHYIPALRQQPDYKCDSVVGEMLDYLLDINIKKRGIKKLCR